MKRLLAKIISKAATDAETIGITLRDDEDPIELCLEKGSSFEIEGDFLYIEEHNILEDGKLQILTHLIRISDITYIGEA